MADLRRLAAILAADVVGFSRLVGVDEERTLAQLRALQGDVIDPLVAEHAGRVFKRTGDGVLIEFRSVVQAVRCAIAVQGRVVERGAGEADESRMRLRIGIHLGEVVEEPDGDLLGDGVNVAARLEGAAEADGLCLSQAAYDLVRDKVSLAFTDEGEVHLKNIARPLRLYRLTLGEGAAITPLPPAHPTSSPSIAVLPFHDLGGDGEGDYFADGIVEDLIIGLSRIRWLLVIARNSSSIYKGRAVDVRVVGRDLGVRYVLEGSVRRGRDRLRITAQLVDTVTGAHLWAERYDGSPDDVFDLQDRITDSVIGIVEPKLRRSEIERSRRKRPDSVNAYDLYLQALPLVTRYSIEGVETGAALLRRALALDPDYPAAHALLAWCEETRFTQSFDPATKASALAHARAAVAGGVDDPMAIALAAIVISQLAGGHLEAMTLIDRALALNPSCAAAHYFGARVHAFAGHTALAVGHAERALRLSPFDLLSAEAQGSLAIVAIQQDRYDDAAKGFAVTAQMASRQESLVTCHALALALAGRVAEGRALLGEDVERAVSVCLARLREMGMVPAILDRFSRGADLIRASDPAPP